MTLIVEDGTGKADAESYCSTADADAYHTARGNSLWVNMTLTEKEQSLRRATDFMVQVYRERWAGYRNTTTQALDWPRTWVPIPDAPVGYRSFPAWIEATVVPADILRATASLAYRAAQGELAPDIDPQVSNETVGPISVTYEPGAPQVVTFREIENLLSPYMKRSKNSIKVTRR